MSFFLLPFKLIYQIIIFPFKVIFWIIVAPFRLIIYITKQIGKFLAGVILISFYALIFATSWALGIWLITQPLFWLLLIPSFIVMLLVVIFDKPKNTFY